MRAFLLSRRARITPEQAGLPVYGGKRRVPGLRREEVAVLANLSADYVVQMERGNLRGVSEGVLNAVANALQLDEAERTHLFDLARVQNASGARPRRPSPKQIRPGLQRVLDVIDAPAWIRNGRADILATNRLGRALYAPVLDEPTRPANTARFTFLNPRGVEFYRDWEPPRRTWSPCCAPKPAATPTAD